MEVTERSVALLKALAQHCTSEFAYMYFNKFIIYRTLNLQILKATKLGGGTNDYCLKWFMKRVSLHLAFCVPIRAGFLHLGVLAHAREAVLRPQSHVLLIPKSDLCWRELLTIMMLGCQLWSILKMLFTVKTYSGIPPLAETIREYCNISSNYDEIKSVRFFWTTLYMRQD
jgi:hypothetical protein